MVYNPRPRAPRAPVKTVAQKYMTRLESNLVTILARPLKRKANLDKIPRDPREFYVYVCGKSGVVNDGPPVFPEYLADMYGQIIHKSLSTGEPVHGKKTVVSCPPRHLKTSTALVGLLYNCVFYRSKKMIYTSYSVEITREAAAQFTKMAIALGYDKGTVDKKIINGNVIYFKALKGGITALGSNWITIVDDSCRGQDDAFSSTIREQTKRTFESNLLTRSQHENLSLFVIGTRFHEEDLLGHCMNKLKFESHIFPAITKEGNALFPELHPIDWLLQQKEMVSPYTWNTLYMCKPPTETDSLSVFRKTIRRISELDLNDPRNRILQTGLGIDLAYTVKTDSDLCSFVKIGKTMSGVYLITDQYGKQVSLDVFFHSINQLIIQKQPLHWYCSSIERGFKSEIEISHGVKIKTHLSLGKLANSKFFADAWNQGKIYVPDEWTLENCPLLDQIFHFTGQASDKDDCLDAAAAAFDSIEPRTQTLAPDSRFFGVRI